MPWCFTTTWEDEPSQARLDRLNAMSKEIGEPFAVRWTKLGCCALWVFDDQQAGYDASAKLSLYSLKVDDDGQQWLFGDRYPSDSPFYEFTMERRSDEYVKQFKRTVDAERAHEVEHDA